MAWINNQFRDESRMFECLLQSQIFHGICHRFKVAQSLKSQTDERREISLQEINIDSIFNRK